MSSEQIISTPEADDMPKVEHFTFLRHGQPTEGAHLGWMACAEKLSGDSCDRITDACHKFDLVPPVTVSEELRPGHRRADTRMVMVTEETEWVYALICEIAEQATDQAYDIALTGITRAPQYVEYRPGWGEFGWHNDYSHGIADAPRKLTVIVQLSDPGSYEGGVLQVMGNEIEDMPKERGSIIVFPSILMHRVTPVTAGLRSALVAWIAGPRHV